MLTIVYTAFGVGRLPHYVTSHPGQLSLATPPWVGAMSIGDGCEHRFGRKRRVLRSIVVFWPPVPVPNFKDHYFSWDTIHGVGKFIFDWNLRFFSETVQDRPYGCYGTLMGSHRWRIDPCQFRWHWETLKGGTRWIKFFRRISLITLVPFDLERPNSTGEGRTSRGSAMPLPQGAGPKCNPIWGFHYA